jgi:tRNA U38,U39,U40 pseudouridine synthase TruA
MRRKAGAVDPEWETNPQKAFFQRASRTDKGVSAAKMIVSLKLLDDPGTIRKEKAFLVRNICNIDPGGFF